MNQQDTKGAANAIVVEHASAAIVKILLDLPPELRAEVFLDVQFNGIFCCECGRGSPESPNENCQCQNDE